VLEVTVDSMVILEEGEKTAVVAVRDRSAPAGVVSELEVVFNVTVRPKTNLLIFPPNTEPVRASGPGRSDSRVVAGSSALPRLMFFINVAEARTTNITELSFTAEVDPTSWSGGSELASTPRDWLKVEMAGSPLGEPAIIGYIGETMNVVLNFTYVPTEVRRPGSPPNDASMSSRASDTD
jgi:hypothetical protein